MLAFPAIHWYRQHEREVRQDEEAKAKSTANMSELESTLGRLKVTWLANDDWEDDLPGESEFYDPYTVDIKHTLVKGYPLIFYGNVEDVLPADEHGNSTVQIKVHGRKSKIQLRLLLTASPEQTALIIKNKNFRQCGGDELCKVSIFVATVDGVRRVADRDFVANGTLHEAYASEVDGEEFFASE
jgi:hypothetical protein